MEQNQHYKNLCAHITNLEHQLRSIAAEVDRQQERGAMRTRIMIHFDDCIKAIQMRRDALIDEIDGIFEQQQKSITTSLKNIKESMQECTEVLKAGTRFYSQKPSTAELIWQEVLSLKPPITEDSSKLTVKVSLPTDLFDMIAQHGKVSREPITDSDKFESTAMVSKLALDGKFSPLKSPPNLGFSTSFTPSTTFVPSTSFAASPVVPLCLSTPPRTTIQPSSASPRFQFDDPTTPITLPSSLPLVEISQTPIKIDDFKPNISTPPSNPQPTTPRPSSDKPATSDPHLSGTPRSNSFNSAYPNTGAKSETTKPTSLNEKTSKTPRATEGETLGEKTQDQTSSSLPTSDSDPATSSGLFPYSRKYTFGSASGSPYPIGISQPSLTGISPLAASISTPTFGASTTSTTTSGSSQGLWAPASTSLFTPLPSSPPSFGSPIPSFAAATSVFGTPATSRTNTTSPTFGVKPTSTPSLGPTPSQIPVLGPISAPSSTSSSVRSRSSSEPSIGTVPVPDSPSSSSSSSSAASIPHVPTPSAFLFGSHNSIFGQSVSSAPKSNSFTFSSSPGSCATPTFGEVPNGGFTFFSMFGQTPPNQKDEKKEDI